MYSALILCAGKNTRLKKLKKKIIKPLIFFQNKTLLEHHLDILNKINIQDIFINTHKNKEPFFLLKKKNKLNFKIINEKILKGTAGVVFSNYKKLNKNILIVYGDNYLNINIKNFFSFFENNNLDFLMGVYKKKDFSNSGYIEFDNRNCIKKFIEKNPLFNKKSGYANAGIYLFKKKFFKNIKKNKFLDFSKDIFSQKIFNKKSKVYKIKSCTTFDTASLIKKNLNMR
tara:strand:- start:177 stop:860 length:684 start_codon:yes stop_codon:yes gene_type:complete